MFYTPVLLIIFNRPEIVQRVFEQIRKVKPQYLFIAADGPRLDTPDDIQKCAATREIVNQIDWECNLKTLFREQNRGCGHGPAEAITWFFEHVEQGIILEDDCFADKSFFSFCEELLEKYRYDEKISMIGGTNPLLNWKSERFSYIFSNIGFSWGWASWRRAWKHFDYHATQWATIEGREKVQKQLKNGALFNHYANEFDFYFKEVRNDVWDFQWLFCRLYHQSYGIIPAINLIANIGFDENSTHTFDANMNFAQLPFTSTKIPLKHPSLKKIDTFFDWYVFERFINSEKRNLFKKITLKLVKHLVKYNIIK